MNAQGMSDAPAYSERFWQKLDTGDPEACWPWTGGRRGHGYGVFHPSSGSSRGAHRVAYELAIGPIPAGLVIDHLCRNRLCCNPAHLEAVTQAENVRRGDRGRRVTVCAQGHEYTPDNTRIRTNGRRACRACDREWHRRVRQARDGVAA